jgi:hypothetical protein
MTRDAHDDDVGGCRKVAIRTNKTSKGKIVAVGATAGEPGINTSTPQRRCTSDAHLGLLGLSVGFRRHLAVCVVVDKVKV